MVFSSLLFLFIFLPAILAIYYILPHGSQKGWRNGFLFISSLIFYAWGEPVYVFLMLFTTFFGWLVGLWLEKLRGRQRQSKAVLAVSIAVNLGLLCFYKYGDFIVDNINRVAGARIDSLRLPLPLGISFYTFQILSYCIDIYRGSTPAQTNIMSFGAYISMFPQLIAGPIIRYNTVSAQLSNRRETLSLFGSGAGLFTAGLAKKVLLANTIGSFWDNIKALPSGEMTVLAAWTGITAFGLQLYFDFSGYSDMAVGLGKMLGFSFEPNFDYPYTSGSITEFWRRWHISLGAWFREYLYIPLGGNRQGQGRTALNLLVVWAATGFWHGASWNFVFWGLYYCAFILGERFLWGESLEKAPKGLRHLYVILIVMAGWALFVFEDTASLAAFMKALTGSAGGGLCNDRILYLLSSWGLILLAAATGATSLAASVVRRLETVLPAGAIWIKPGLMGLGFLLSVAYLVDSSYNPFLYFRF